MNEHVWWYLSRSSGIVRGRAVALAAADRHGLAMRLTCADGRTVESPAWQEFAR